MLLAGPIVLPNYWRGAGTQSFTGANRVASEPRLPPEDSESVAGRKGQHGHCGGDEQARGWSRRDFQGLPLFCNRCGPHSIGARQLSRQLSSRIAPRSVQRSSEEPPKNKECSQAIPPRSSEKRTWLQLRAISGRNGSGRGVKNSKRRRLFLAHRCAHGIRGERGERGSASTRQTQLCPASLI